MKQERVQRIRNAMREQNLSQLLISDPAAIFYVCGQWFEPGERLVVLVLTPDACSLVVNTLFSASEEGVSLVWYSDGEDAVALVKGLLEPGLPLGVDRKWPAGFLLPLQACCPETVFVNGSEITDGVRQVKDAQEQALMREVSRINDAAMEQLIPLVSQGYTELELCDKLALFYRELGADGYSFPPIAAFGKGGVEPHHIPGAIKGRAGEAVVLDIGCRKNDYVSDMTRTVFIKEAPKRAAYIYEVVLEAQRLGIEAARPGNLMCDVDRVTRDYIESKGFGAYFTHRTGHSIGIEVHEPGGASLDNHSVIQPGQCFSVEPGIYIPEEGIGIRIEDLVLITENGCEVLNRVSKDLQIVK